MRGSTDVDYILSDCFLAVGQAVGPGKTLEPDTVIWWHRRYREAFHYAVTAFDRAAKLLRSFCSLGGITAMQ